MTDLIGITERGDAALDTSWLDYYNQGGKVVLITKNVGKLLHVIEHLSLETERMIVHATITGLGGTFLEPNVPDPISTFSQYLRAVELLGSERTVLRIDPIIPTSEFLPHAEAVFDRYVGAGKPSRIRISFLDNYRHILKRWPECPTEHGSIKLRHGIWQNFGCPEICGEAGFDAATGCISDRDLDALGVEYKIPQIFRQRQVCRCSNKLELLQNKTRCKHQCVYCYWKD